MRVDPHNLMLRLIRGRTRTLMTRFGQKSTIDPALLTSTSLINPPQPGGQIVWTEWGPKLPWVPIDISAWTFAFAMRTQFSSQQPGTTVVLAKNPIQNMSDPTQGILMWQVLSGDTKMLTPQNYVFDMSVVVPAVAPTPMFFCGGIVVLLDNVNDAVFVPPIAV